jgi:glycerate kinase
MSLTVLVAPDSFKGSLDSVAVARALATGWRAARPGDTLELVPLADGGEGTLEAIRVADPDWSVLPAATRDPIDRPIAGRFLRNGGRAVVELADASGLSRLAPGERDPLGASTFGTGLTLAAAIGLGVREIVLGVGGSATTDGGSGVLEALGAVFFDASGTTLRRGGGALARLDRLDLHGLSPLLAEVSLTIASDVTNPLLGDFGAAAVYGPQKGATTSQVAALDAALSRYADVLERTCGRPVRDVPGAGAAGGTIAGLLAIADRFLTFGIRPGVEVVMEASGFAEGLARAAVVITAEGRVDAQTAFGKTALGVARRAADAGLVCIAVTGAVTLEGESALGSIGAVVVPVSEGPATLEEAMAAGPGPIERAARRAASLFSMGGRLRA